MSPQFTKSFRPCFHYKNIWTEPFGRIRKRKSAQNFEFMCQADFLCIFFEEFTSISKTNFASNIVFPSPGGLDKAIKG